MKTICSIFFVICLCIPKILFAGSSMSISEIMYDVSGADSGHEWVEAYNTSSTAITIVGGSGSGSWRFNDGSNHFLAQTPALGTFVIPSGGYVIFADDASIFLTDHPGFTGVVIDTTISLANAGGVVKLIDGDGNVLDSVSYTNTQGATGDGNTLQLAGSSWIAATPTPNAPAASTSTTTTANSNTTATAITPSPTPTKSLSSAVAYETPHMQAVVVAPLDATVGIPIKISAVVYGTAKEYRQAGVFSFALGDGSEHVSNVPPTFEYTYLHPGQYVLLFEYRTSTYMTDPEVSFRQVIEVTAPTVSISGRTQDGGIELKNTSDADANISGWWIASGDMQFHIPRGTILLPGKTVVLELPKIEPNVTVDTTSVRLLLPSGALVSEYGIPNSSVTITKVKSSTSIEPYSAPASEVVASATPLLLSANAIDAIATKEGQATHKKSIAPFVLGVMGLVTASFFALRKAQEGTNDEVVVDSSVESQRTDVADTIRIIEE